MIDSGRIGFIPRAIALLIDAIILTVGLQILSMILPNLITGPAGWGNAADGMPVTSLLIVLIYASMEIFLAATPGKLILKLKIKAQDGGIADNQTLLIRYLIKQSPQILALLFVLLQLKILWTLETIAGLVIFFGCFLTFRMPRQALHDMPAKTAVFKG